ncbi:uncharacterized protein BDZ99DRAFT_504590 [Mytilinidion resinicola]|uniref:RING-type domain-containing protein n=1 Tax=Mytilinidion resinicola TaxID=574789 RepID=A0A6A6Y0C5_9PEZI|nr:uncharacterized protein BDZ99DRAFT_504590 [Mytilinidion resinicola]KAF2801464.1 hypothetical protein BDZ99DRAFT_504590 [Mytilinidion resinicola]
MSSSTTTLNVVTDSTRPAAANIILRPTQALTGGVMKNIHADGVCTYEDLVIRADGEPAQQGNLHILYPGTATVKLWYGEPNITRDVHTIIPAIRAREQLPFPHGRNPYAGLRTSRVERVSDHEKRIVTKKAATAVFEFGEQSVRVRAHGEIALECLEPEDETEIQQAQAVSQDDHHWRGGLSSIFRRRRDGRRQAGPTQISEVFHDSSEEVWEMPTGAEEDVPLEFVGPRTNVDELSKPTTEKDLPECSICQDDQYGDGHHAVKLNACGHIFGAECLEVMFNHRFAASNACPNCRIELATKKERRAVHT